MKTSIINNKIDNVIRVLLCVLLFFLPYSKAVVETAVVSSCFLWIIKHSLILIERRRKIGKPTVLLSDLRLAFSPTENVLNRGIALFLLFCLLSIVGSYLPAQSLRGFLTKTIEGFAIYLIVLEVFVTRRQVRVAILVFVATAFITGLDTLAQFYVTHQDLFRQRSLVEGYRATGGFQHPNLLGAFLAVAIPVTISLFLAAIRKSHHALQRNYFAVASLVLIWALMLTFSRGAWMGTAIGMIFFVLVLVGQRLNPWARRLLIVFVMVAGTLSVFQVFEIKKQMSIVKNESETAAWRVALWREGLYLIKQRPFLGHGLNTFMPVMENHIIRVQSPLAVGYSASYAHNCYVQMAVEVGVLGLGAFLGIMVILFQKVLSALPKQRDLRFLVVGLLSGLLAFLVHSSVDINFYSVELPLLFWLMAGFVISLDKQLSPPDKYAIN